MFDNFYFINSFTKSKFLPDFVKSSWSYVAPYRLTEEAPLLIFIKNYLINRLKLAINALFRKCLQFMCGDSYFRFLQSCSRLQVQHKYAKQYILYQINNSLQILHLLADRFLSKLSKCHYNQYWTIFLKSGADKQSDAKLFYFLLLSNHLKPITNNSWSTSSVIGKWRCRTSLCFWFFLVFGSANINIFWLFQQSNSGGRRKRTNKQTKKRSNFYSSSKFCCKRKLAAMFSFFSQAKKACITSPSGKPSSFSCN